MVPSELNAQVADREPISIVVICGPTGSGKGGLARALASRLCGEIVSADSRKVYRRMDVGTAKPDAAARSAVRHHLLDVVEPGERFSAARFVELADQAIAQIRSRGRLPIVAGGTGLYLRSLLHGIIQTPPRDDALRRRLEAAEAAAPGWLHARLDEVDPQTARRLPPGDALRLVRALEVIELTGRPISRIQADHGLRAQRYRALSLAPDWPRAELHARIDRRVLRLIELGWLEEVAALRVAGATRALEVVGYCQLDRHLAGGCDLEAAVAAIQAAHRRYARQQLTWFRAMDGLRWLPAPVDEGALELEVRGFLGG